MPEYLADLGNWACVRCGHPKPKEKAALADPFTDGLLTLGQAAERAQCSYDYLYLAVRSGHLLTTQVGNRHYVSPDALREWAENRKTRKRRITAEVDFVL